MSLLRNQLESSQATYRRARYPGDLAAELLPEKRGITIAPMAFGKRWFIPFVAGALAAMLAIVFWHHKPAMDHSVPRIADGGHSPKPSPKLLAWTPSIPSFERVEYDKYVTPMRTGMKAAVSQLGANFDGALDAPIVSDGVATVGHVAGDIQEVALATWSQVRPRREPGL